MLKKGIMTTNDFETVTITDKDFHWRYVTKVINDFEEHHYRVAEIGLERFFDSSIEFFKHEYEPPVYFAPIEVLRKDDSSVVKWCEKHNMHFD